MFVNALGVIASMYLGGDTVVVLGHVERDITGDQTAEVLRVVGRGVSIDSLDVTFSIESAGRVIFETRLQPLIRSAGLDAGRSELSAAEHRTRLVEFAEWFFADGKFMRPESFVDHWRTSAPGHVLRIPEVIARNRRRQFVLDSLRSAGHSGAELEARAVLLVTDRLDTATAAASWQEVRRSGATVFEFSPGGDRVQAIVWSARDQRFIELVECC